MIINNEIKQNDIIDFNDSFSLSFQLIDSQVHPHISDTIVYVYEYKLLYAKIGVSDKDIKNNIAQLYKYLLHKTDSFNININFGEMEGLCITGEYNINQETLQKI